MRTNDKPVLTLDATDEKARYAKLCEAGALLLASAADPRNDLPADVFPAEMLAAMTMIRDVVVATGDLLRYANPDGTLNSRMYRAS